MDLYSNYDPIIACSTPSLSPMAISVVRLSGFEDFGPIEPFFNIELAPIEPNTAKYCKLLDLQGNLVDEVVITFFKGPNSFNGENILEISAHGNPALVEKIICLFIHYAGFRLAKNGEFSLRALRNKKMDLFQVEGLDLLLNSKNTYAIEQGHSFLSGKLKDLYVDLHNTFLEHKSSLEFFTDFFEDVGEQKANDLFKNSLAKLHNSVNSLSERVIQDPRKLLSPEVVLIGEPNAGKSTLFNALLNQQRSIVTDIKGTTRDYISETININNSYYTLIDTAGLRETSDKVESIGVELSKTFSKNSFYKVLVINPADFNEANYKDIKDVNFDLLVCTHSKKNQKIPKIENFFPSILNVLKIDLVNDDLLELRTQVFDFISNQMSSLLSSSPILLSRHIPIINDLQSNMRNYVEICECDDVGIIASEIQIIEKNISELIGIISPNDVLQHIFSNFCIGK
jgi:tRNA modification GTPase